MPAIRGLFYNHPTTGVAGLWIQLLNGNIIGRTDAQIAAFVGSGNTATKIARLRTAFKAYMQPLLETRTPMSSFTAEQQTDIIANPQPFYRVDGTDYVSQDSVIEIEVINLSPLRYQITISEGASNSTIIYN